MQIENTNGCCFCTPALELESQQRVCTLRQRVTKNFRIAGSEKATYRTKLLRSRANTTSCVIIWSLNFIFPSDFRMAAHHCHLKLPYDGDWKLFFWLPQPVKQQRAGILRVCARSCCMLIEFSGQIIADALQLVPLASQRLYRLPQK